MTVHYCIVFRIQIVNKNRFVFHFETRVSARYGVVIKYNIGLFLISANHTARATARQLKLNNVAIGHESGCKPAASALPAQARSRGGLLRSPLRCLRAPNRAPGVDEIEP